jgi:hypothetical protein
VITAKKFKFFKYYDDRWLELMFYVFHILVTWIIFLILCLYKDIKYRYLIIDYIFHFS